LIGADTVRRWEHRDVRPDAARAGIIFAGLPAETVDIELEVECSGDGDEREICWVTEARESTSGEALPVDCGVDLTDGADIERLVRYCAAALAEADGLKPGVTYRVNVRIMPDGSWGCERSGFVAFHYVEGAILEPEDYE
jgi:hypothetical protein